MQGAATARWSARSAEALTTFHDAVAVAVVNETTPDNLVGVGDQLHAAVRDFRAYLENDPCPDAPLAGVHDLVASAYGMLGTVLVLFDGLTRPSQLDCLARVHRLQGEVGALAALEELLADR